MSQHVINCPSCNKQHEVDAFRSGGIANVIMTLGNPDCSFSTEDRVLIRQLLGLEETHRQRMRNGEMPKIDR